MRLKTEVEDLTGRGREEVAERLLKARELGDLKENAEYHSAKDAQGLMEARIRDIEAKLRDPEIVETPQIGDAVAEGMLVTVLPLDDVDDEEETYLIANSAEERARGARTVTTSSPLGSVLVGCAKDDEVTYKAPGGTFRYRIVGFEPYTG